MMDDIEFHGTTPQMQLNETESVAEQGNGSKEHTLLF
jgi:hypothetical protein